MWVMEFFSTGGQTSPARLVVQAEWDWLLAVAVNEANKCPRPGVGETDVLVLPPTPSDPEGEPFKTSLCPQTCG